MSILTRCIRENVFSNDPVDNVIKYKLHRLTPASGVIGTFNVFEVGVDVPKTGDRYHIYALGNINLIRIGISPEVRSVLQQNWVPLAGASAVGRLTIRIISEDGLIASNNDCFVSEMISGNILIAIKSKLKADIPLAKEPVYLTTYRNAYLGTDGSLVYKSKAIVNDGAEELIDIITGYPSSDNSTSFIVNGLFYTGLPRDSLRVQDTIDAAMDDTVESIITHSLDSLYTFKSTLHDTYKYILPYKTSPSTKIRYHNETDIYVTGITSVGNRVGVLYANLQEDDVTMITNDYYGVKTDKVQYLLNKLSDRLGTLTSPAITMVVRHMSNPRTIIPSRVRMDVLHKLPVKDVLNLLSPSSVNLNLWLAANLEADYYTRSMGNILTSSKEDVDLSLVALGLHAMMYFEGKGVMIPDTASVKVPICYVPAFTLYSYNNGTLVSKVGRTNDYNLTVSNDIDVLEFIPGIHNDAFATRINDGTTVPVNTEYSIYIKDINTLTEVTGDATKYTIVDNKIRRTSGFLRSFYISKVTQCFNRDYLLGDTFYKDNAMVIPVVDGNGDYVYELYSTIEVSLNGKWLMDTVDFKVDLPYISITNSEFIDHSKDKQLVHVRSYGVGRFDTKSTTHVGVVTDGAISVLNDITSVHPGNTIVTYNGTRRLLDHYKGISNLPNGTLYTLSYPNIPTARSFLVDQRILKNNANVTDGSIRDLLLSKYNAVPIPTGAGEMVLVSPFIAKMLHIILDRSDSTLDVINSPSLIDTFCASYVYLLDYEPGVMLTTELKSHITTIPHGRGTVVRVSSIKYNLISDIITHYNLVIPLTNYIEE